MYHLQRISIFSWVLGLYIHVDVVDTCVPIVCVIFFFISPACFASLSVCTRLSICTRRVRGAQLNESSLGVASKKFIASLTGERYILAMFALKIYIVGCDNRNETWTERLRFTTAVLIIRYTVSHFYESFKSLM